MLDVDDRARLDWGDLSRRIDDMIAETARVQADTERVLAEVDSSRFERSEVVIDEDGRVVMRPRTRS